MIEPSTTDMSVQTSRMVSGRTFLHQLHHRVRFCGSIQLDTKIHLKLISDKKSKESRTSRRDCSLNTN